MAERGNPQRLAGFQQLCERGMSRAAEALGRLLGRPVQWARLEIRDPGSSAMPALADDGDGNAAALRIQFHGDGRGWILILIPYPAVTHLLRTLLGTRAEPRDLTEIERSAIQELGNVAASSFLTEIGDRLGRRLLPSVPEITLGNAGDALRVLLAAVAERGEGVLVVQALLEDRERDIHARIFIVQEPGALTAASRGAPGTQGVFS